MVESTLTSQVINHLDLVDVFGVCGVRQLQRRHARREDGDPSAGRGVGRGVGGQLGQAEDVTVEAQRFVVVGGTDAEAQLAYRDLIGHALKSAVAQARSKAETLAAAANATLGQVTAMVEGGGVVPPPAAGARDTTVPIEPGTQRIEASVSVTFALG